MYKKGGLGSAFFRESESASQKQKKTCVRMIKLVAAKVRLQRPLY